VSTILSAAMPSPDSVLCGDVQFSMGRRDCAGRNMAMLEGTTLLALLHARFDFTPVDGYKFEPEATGFVQVPKDGLHLRVSLRQ
jgi:cytochrome P450